jgi:AcrR family transcriptional regulator
MGSGEERKWGPPKTTRQKSAKNRASIVRAPGRGKYDRSQSADERHSEQRGRLIDAAGHVFADVGWADATVEAIVTRAGMSRRTFYEHFDDLKDCLLTFHEHAIRQAFNIVESAVVGVKTRSPHELLVVGVGGFLGSIAAFPHVARVVFRVVRAAGPEFEAAHDEMIGRFVKLLMDGVARAHEDGLTDLPADEVRVFALVSGMEAVAMRYVMRGEEARAMDVAPILIDMVERTFGLRPQAR